ncbi:GEVED domain-containing protein [Winogradskyella sp. PC D3.3]
MKKITLFLIMLGCFLTASAQYDFPPIVGPTTVVSGENTAINVNDIANTAGVPASSTGSYISFLVTAEWVAGDGNPWSNEAQLTLTTTAGDVLIDPATTGGGTNGDNTTLTFVGEFPAIYDPTVDGYLDLVFDQSYAGSEADYNNIVVTLYESPACPNPSGMTTALLTTTTVDLIWTAGDSETAWNVEYSTSDFTPGNGEEEGSANVTGSAATSFSGLTENTNYYVYYQADCGTVDGTSEWVGPFTFLTGYCESVPTSVDGDGITQVELGTEIFTSAGDDVTYEDFTGTTVDLASQVTSNLQITFATGPTYNTNIWIDFNNDLVFDNATEIVFQGTSEGVNPTVFNASFLMPDVPLGVYNMRIGTADFNQSAAAPDPCYSGTWGVTMDFSINVTAAPNCIPPSALTTNGIGANNAELAWTQAGTVSQWNVEVVPTGTAPTGNPTATNVTNPYNASGLDGLTTYDYYVQANCGSELSLWSGPYTFTTLCDVTIPDYFQDFTDVTFALAPECWDEANNGTPTTGPTDLGASSWTSDGFLNDGFTGAYKVNIYGTSLNDWILSPQFDLTGGPFQVEFDFGITNWGNATAGTLGSDDEVQLLISNDNGATWTTLLTYDSTSNVSASGEHPVVNLSAYNGQIVQFGIYATDGTVDDTTDVDVFVDNFQVRAVPSCPEPNDLAVTNITPDGAELTWTEAGTSTIWNVEIVEAGEAPTGTPTDTNVSNPYIATGLNPVTSYDFYVQSDCSGDLSSFTGPISFTTLCDIFVPDYIQNFATITPDCWEEASEGTPTTGPTDLGNSSWNSDEFLNSATGSLSYNINVFGSTLTTFNDWIITPQFDLTGGPFQVEFDFGITEWISSTVAGTLGSDDTVQLLISTDNGATWVNLLTYDSTSVIPITGVHPVIDLTAYSGQIVQFAIYATSGTVVDTADNDIFVDNFRVRGIPTCPEPTDLSASALTLTSTELSWIETGTATSWNIQYGEAGFPLGSGTYITDVTTNPYTLSGLTADTSYEYYVQAICSPGDESSYNGPFQFYTGYCESLPTSNDGDGVNNVTLGLTDFPSAGDVFYENNTASVVDVFRGLDTNLEIEFGHSATYNTNIWIDFNDDLILDDTELVYQGASTGGNNPHMQNASFLMPITAPLGQHRLRIVTTDFLQTPANPCYNGSWGVTLDFTVNIQELNCTLAEADYTVVPDCASDQFSIAVNILDLGDATSLEISNTFNTDIVIATDTETYSVGPFDFGTEVRVFVASEQDSDCTISSDNYLIVACPPVNDNPCDATTAVVNDQILCENRTPGTLLAGSASGIPEPSCGGSADDDVWFQFEATSEYQLIAIANIVGGDDSDIDHSVYEGTCDNLTEISCTSGFAELSSVTPQLTIGNTYYIRVYSGGTSNVDTTFELCITPYIPPVNLECDLADNYCSGSDASDILYTYNTINVLPGDGQIDCLFTTPNPTYSVLEIGTTGDILIEMVQNSAFDENDNPIGDELDVDFILWGPFGPGDDLCDLSSVVDCSYSAAPVENVTLLGAQEGEIYLLLITNFEKEPGIIQVRQTNVGEPGSGSTIADINASITSNDVLIDPNNDPLETDEVSVCGFTSVTIETDSPFADDFVWFKNGEPIVGENSSTLVVTESDNYQVQAFDSQCNANALSQVVIINLYKDPEPLAPQTLIACDGPEADGIESFDLDALTSSLGLDGFTLSYYTNTDAANQALPPLSSPYESAGETLIIRIEDADAALNGYTGCRELSQVELIVNPRPVINQPDDFVVCDDLDGAVDGVTEFDLISINDDVTTDNTMIISYHTSLQAAEDGDGALTSPYSSSGETIYVRAQDAVTGCYQTTSFDLEINIVPLAEFDLQYDYIVCPPPSLAEKTIGIIPSNFTDADVTVTWTLDGNPFSGSGLTLNNVVVAGDYSATITFNETGCSNTITTTVEEAETCIFPEGISPGVSPGQNDTFDLRAFDVTKLEIFNRYGTLVYSKKNYTNEWVGQSNDGEELPVGTYFYTVEYEGGTKTKSAWVYINR